MTIKQEQSKAKPFFFFLYYISIFVCLHESNVKMNKRIEWRV